MMQVYLIRHAQSEVNVQLDEAPLTKRLSRTAFNALVRSDIETPLTPNGVVQAQQLAQRLTEIHFDRLYTSPLSRALATATSLSEVTNLTPQIIEDLRELKAVQLRERAGESTLLQLFWQSYTRMLFSPASPDAFGLSYRRARAVWRQITCEPAERIAVVSHGWFLRFLLLTLVTDRRWRIVSRDLANCGISLVVSRG